MVEQQKKSLVYNRVYEEIHPMSSVENFFIDNDRRKYVRTEGDQGRAFENKRHVLTKSAGQHGERFQKVTHGAFFWMRDLGNRHSRKIKYKL